jgi:glycerol-3-phosphate dehydrogenase (NAD(P)+)
MNISVLGCGRWGSFIAWYLNKINHNVTIWGRSSSKNLEVLKKSRKNAFLELEDSIKITSNIDDALNRSEIVVISISSQSLRQFLAEIKDKIKDLENKIFVLCMKGIEEKTGKRLSVVLKEVLGEKAKVAVWVGPGHVQDFVKGIPNCMVIDSEEEGLKKYLVEKFSSNLIRFYYGNDMIGSEIGAAAKNVMGIAAGILDGMGFGSLKGALMSRGTREISRLIKALGGNELSAYGLAHLGDYQATLFSPHSNNRNFGELLVKEKNYEKLAEGVATSHALKLLSKQTGTELPISNAVHETILGNISPKDSIAGLFLRSIKSEF